jgi:hypothetical protein
MWKFSVQAAPVCANLIKGCGATLGISEFAAPLITGGPNNIGPVTSYVTNEHFYQGNNLAYPIKTRLDVTYEHAWGLNEQSVKDGGLSVNPLAKRTFSITSPLQMVALGLDS